MKEDKAYKRKLTAGYFSLTLRKATAGHVFQRSEMIHLKVKSKIC